MLKMIEQSIESSWYIYICMLGVIAMGLYFIHKLSRYKKDFANATLKIKNDSSYVEDLRKQFEKMDAESEPLFQEKKLQTTFTAYRDAYRKILAMKDAAPFVDITDFYNGEYLDEIGYTGICDLISGTMTGLGILGTFLGLVLGISGFDTATTEAITSSISSLLSGMGTAFFTSIVGVFLSLLFSYFHKVAYDCANKSMENFVIAFHDKNLDGFEKNAENQLLNYQKQQTELLGNFATVVSEAVSSSISNTLKTELIPIFDRMENTIEQFGALASQQQKEGLDRVVKEFIHCMNESLNQQFEELSDTIHEICEWQKSSTEQMQKVVDGICDTSDEINRINDLSKQTVSEMSCVMQQLKSYYEELSAETEQVRKQIDRSNEVQEQQAVYLEKLVECENHITELSESVKVEIENHKRTIDTLAEHCKEQVSDIEAAAKQSLEMVTESTKTVADVSQKQIEAVALAAANEMQILSDTAARLNEENHKQLAELTKVSSGQIALLTSATDNAQKSVDTISDHCKEQVSGIEMAAKQSLEMVAESTKTVADVSQKQIEAVALAAANEMQILSDIAARLNEENHKQLAELTKVSSGQIALLTSATDNAQKSVDVISDHCKDQISGIVDAAKQDMETLSASTKVLAEASHAQMETLAQTAESEMQMLSSTAAQLSEENHKQLLALTKASSDQMTVISEAANNVMQNSQQQIEAAIAATQTQSEALMQATNDFADFVQQEHRKLVDAVDKEVSGLSNFAGQTTNELQSATASMENAAKLLDKNLDEVLDRTFTSFDSSLTDISQHLSGTIADVRDTTEALPHVIRESQKQYETVLAKLTSQTQSYLNAMEKMTALVKQNLPVVTDEEGNRQ